jgi:phosphate:Na+ symporter
MLNNFDIWLFLAGLGIFLFGLHYIELALKNLAGRSFKKFLRKQTTNPIKGIIGGAGITAILQSSSVVSLMVMAFVGARILSMKSALGIIFGSNLGTTFTGWIVALLGFKFDIEGFALPLVAVGGLTVILFSNIEKVYNFGRFTFGFGLLFIGLNWMKGSIEYLALNFDVSVFSGINPYWYFFIGLILTAVVQSSSAIMVIALSALSVDAITIEAAATLVIGSNIGTTVTVIMGAIKGTPAKKQVAAGHVLFNTITAVVALIILYPLLWVIMEILGIKDSLMILVCFHSLFNLMGILLLLPFLEKFSKLLQARFTLKTSITQYISRVSPNIPTAAIEALRNEGIRFTEMVLRLNTSTLKVKSGSFTMGSVIRLFKSDNYSDKYNELKQVEGEIINYSLRVQNEQMTDEEVSKINTVVHAFRSSMQSAKYIKDITHNIREFEASSSDVKLGLFSNHQIRLNDLFVKLTAFIHKKKENTQFEELIELKGENFTIYNDFLQETYKLVKSHRLGEAEISTLLIVNREFYNSNKAIISALSDLILTPEESRDFERLPNLRN